jgi:hypothetical protein
MFCPVCLADRDDAFRLGCGHWFCRGCLAEWAQARRDAPCPVCRQPLAAPERLVLVVTGWPNVAGVLGNGAGALHDVRDDASLYGYTV